MKKISHFTILLLFALLAIVACNKDEDPPVNNDNSLIIAEASTSKYVIVSPTSGAILSIVEPNVTSINQLALGYMSQKAIVTSKPASSGMKVIYTCDRATGDNLFQVTSEHDWDVMFVDVAQTGPQIVFSAQNANLLSDDNIHRINEDGSGYQRLSSPNEVVDVLGIDCKIWAAYDPAWSPNGGKIAFDLHTREVVELHPHNSICIMNADGSNKQVLYDENVEEAQYHDLCFTQDGQFIVFLKDLANNSRAKVLNISNQTITDITNQLTVEGLAPTDLWTSPNTNQIIFNKYEPGGGDLYIIDFTVENDAFQIDGNYRVLTPYSANSLHVGVPDWQLWNEIN